MRLLVASLTAFGFLTCHGTGQMTVAGLERAKMVPIVVYPTELPAVGWHMVLGYTLASSAAHAVLASSNDAKTLPAACTGVVQRGRFCGRLARQHFPLSPAITVKPLQALENTN